MTLNDFSYWGRGAGLEALLLALGAVLLHRFARWGADLLITRAQLETEQTTIDNLVASEASKHQGALAQVGSWSAIAIIYFVASLLILERFNVPLTSIVAPATLVGAAVGFGSQRLVQDVLSGIFIFAERQYGYGDVVTIAQPGQTEGVQGTVEEVTLRTTKLRTLSGELTILPNGEVRQVTNLSKDWARTIVDIPLPTNADVPQATAVLYRISEEIWTDEDWAPLLLDPPSVMGVQSFEVGFLQLRFVARTLPGKQWEVGRELRGRIAAAFRDAGIATAAPIVAASARSI